MKLLKKISAVSLIILTAALLASCNSSPRAGRTIITEASVDISEKDSFTDTLTFVINRESLERDQSNMIDITIESTTSPSYTLSLFLKSDGSGHIIKCDGMEDKTLNSDEFDVTITYSNNTFSIKIEDTDDIPPYTGFGEAKSISVVIYKIGDEGNLDTVSIESSSLNGEWVIKN